MKECKGVMHWVKTRLNCGEWGERKTRKRPVSSAKTGREKQGRGRLVEPR